MTIHVNRRRFLKSSAVLCVSALLDESSFAETPQDKPIHVGIIGCGARGRALLDCLGRQPEALVTAVADSDPARLRTARMFGASEIADWRDMLERPDIEAVVIATPDHLHAEMVEAALLRDKDVYCEAPFCRTRDEAELLRAISKRSGRIVQVGATDVSDPRWHEVRAIVHSGKLGELVWCQVALSPASKAACDRLNWRHAAACSDGPAIQSQFNALAALLYATGLSYPSRISVIGDVDAESGRETPDSLLTTLEYPEGTTVVLAATAAYAPTVLRGTRASLLFTADGVLLQSEDGGSAELAVMTLNHAAAAVTPLDRHLRDWLDAVRARRACVADPTLACKTQAAIHAVFTAFQQRKAVVLDATGAAVT